MFSRHQAIKVAFERKIDDKKDDDMTEIIGAYKFLCGGATEKNIVLFATKLLKLVMLFQKILIIMLERHIL